MTAGGVPQAEIACRVATRIGQREVITRAKPASLLVLIGHSALCQEIGGRQVATDQLKHLLDMAKRPNVELRGVPLGVGWPPGVEGAFNLIECEDSSAGFMLLVKPES